MRLEYIAIGISILSALISAGSLSISIVAYRRNGPLITVECNIPKDVSHQGLEAFQGRVQFSVVLINRGQARAVVHHAAVEVKGSTREITKRSQPCELDEILDLSEQLTVSEIQPFDRLELKCELSVDAADLKYLKFFQVRPVVNLASGKIVNGREAIITRDSKPVEYPIP